jgi:AcrR family transcriptional regulator
MSVRTRTERKRAAILGAARRVFLRRGYRDATMDAISTAARVSKRTLYGHFDSKKALFVAIMRDLCEQIVAPLGRVPANAGVERTLLLLGRQFMRIGMSPWVNSFHRLVVAESQRFPELSRLYYDIGRENLWDVIAAYLAEQAERGRLRITRPELAAEQFCGIIAGHPHVRLQLGIDRRLSRRATKDDMKLGVRLFLDGCRAAERK